MKTGGSLVPNWYEQHPVLSVNTKENKEFSEDFEIRRAICKDRPCQAIQSAPDKSSHEQKALRPNRGLE